MFPTSNTTNASSGSADDSEDLPAGWKKVTSRSNGKAYYLQTSTGATQWEKPVEEGKGKDIILYVF